MDLAHTAAVIVGAAALVGAINFLWLKAVKPAYQGFMKNRQRVIQVDQVPEISVKVTEVQATLGRLEPLILAMHHELHPNSGLSMNDKVTRTEGATGRIESALAEHIADPQAHS